MGTRARRTSSAFASPSRAAARRHVRDAQPRSRHAGEVGDRREQVGEREVDAAEQVALTRDAPLERERVPTGDVAHVHDVETGRGDVAADPPAAHAGDHPTGRRRLAIAVADGRGRVHDHRVETLAQAASSTSRSAASFVRL